MSAILELPEARPLVAHLSVENFHRSGELGIYGKRAELLRGIVFDKLPMTPLHRKLNKRLCDFLQDLALPDFVVFQESPMTLRDSEPLPDISVVAGQDADFDAQHPSTAELVIEVAVSSVALDRENAVLFAEAGVKEYWIVLAARQQVEVYRQPEAGEYRERLIYAGEDHLECGAVPAIRLSLPTLFA